MYNRIYTISTGSTGKGHVTTLHLSIEELIAEVNASLDSEMISVIISDYNETAPTLGWPLYEGSVEDFKLEYIVERDPQLDKGGWSWSYQTTNENGVVSESYLNISVHNWVGTRYNTEG